MSRCLRGEIKRYDMVTYFAYIFNLTRFSRELRHDNLSRKSCVDRFDRNHFQLSFFFFLNSRDVDVLFVSVRVMSNVTAQIAAKTKCHCRNL